jgi:hypothetical protein
MVGVEVYPHSFLTCTLDKSECLASRSDRFTPGERPLFPMNSMLGGPQIRSGRFRGNLIITPARIRTRIPQLSSP